VEGEAVSGGPGSHPICNPLGFYREAQKETTAMETKRETTQAATGQVRRRYADLSVCDCVASADNPRLGLDEKAESFLDLRASIRARGVDNPIWVREHPKEKGKWDVMAGARRLRAAQLEGLLTIPGQVYEGLTDEQAFDLTYIENAYRLDLSPLEEANAVSIGLTHCKGDHKAVADKLGRTVQWVALRERLGQLSAAWRKAIRDSKLPFVHWTAPQLSRIARLDGDLQDVALAALKEMTRYSAEDFADVATWISSDLERWLNDQYLHLFSKAPWKLDDGALDAAAGPCCDCTKRSTCQGSLFHDAELAPKEARKLDRCLDRSCWDRKAIALLKRRHAELLAEHPDLHLLYRGGQCTAEQVKSFGGENKVKGIYDFVSAKRGESGAFPALVLDGTDKPKVEWYKSHDGGSRGRSSSESGEKAVKTLAERREALHARRVNLAASKLLTSVGQDLNLTDHLVMSAAVAFSSEGNASNVWGGAADDKDWANLAAAVLDTPGSIRDALWRRVVQVWKRRFLLLDKNPTRLLAEATSLAKTVSLDWALFKTQADAEIREPKAWKNLNLDGTAKSATDKKGKKTIEEMVKAKQELDANLEAKARAAKTKKPERVCRVCGCTEEAACQLRSGDTCEWVEAEGGPLGNDLCSNPDCLKKAISALTITLTDANTPVKEANKLRKRIERLEARQLDEE
jgi:ParB/RepB/Spo0J family partition protein